MMTKDSLIDGLEFEKPVDFMLKKSYNIYIKRYILDRNTILLCGPWPAVLACSP